MRSSYVSQVLEPSPHCARVSMWLAKKVLRKRHLSTVAIRCSATYRGLASCEEFSVSLTISEVPGQHRGQHVLVTFRFFVGRRTGPLICSCLLWARSIKSRHTFSRACTFREVRVMRWGHDSASAGASRSSQGSGERPTILWFLAGSKASFSPLFILAVWVRGSFVEMGTGGR